METFNEKKQNNRARDGGTPDPENSAHYKYWNPIFNRERATHCLHTRPFNPRCGEDVCLYYDACIHKPPETLRRFERVCPIPFEIANASLEFIKSMPVYNEAFYDEVEKYAINRGKLWWAENVAISIGNRDSLMGGTTGLMFAVEGTPLHAIKVIIRQIERDLERTGNKFGLNPMFAAKLRIDILSGDTIQDQIAKQRQKDIETGKINPAYQIPIWANSTEKKIIECEEEPEDKYFANSQLLKDVADKILEERTKQNENPFNGEAAAEYEMLRRESK